MKGLGDFLRDLVELLIVLLLRACTQPPVQRGCARLPMGNNEQLYRISEQRDERAHQPS